jgi:hypothetical protein
VVEGLMHSIVLMDAMPGDENAFKDWCRQRRYPCQPRELKIYNLATYEHDLPLLHEDLRKMNGFMNPYVSSGNQFGLRKHLLSALLRLGKVLGLISPPSFVPPSEAETTYAGNWRILLIGCLPDYVRDDGVEML